MHWRQNGCTILQLSAAAVEGWRIAAPITKEATLSTRNAVFMNFVSIR
jgi:hypothetical protein